MTEKVKKMDPWKLRFFLDFFCLTSVLWGVVRQLPLKGVDGLRIKCFEYLKKVRKELKISQCVDRGA